MKDRSILSRRLIASSKTTDWHRPPAVASCMAEAF
jgi:hypothetical protein